MTASDEIPTPKPRDVRRRFERAASTFDDADFVHSVTREGLLARLEPVVVTANTVVDLGCATGAATRALARRFRRAHVVSVDISHAMLARARRRRPWFARHSLVQADAAALPFADHSVDVVFSNLMLPWAPDIAAVFGEVARVLRAQGLFAFATLGPDSLDELRNAWRLVDAGAHVLRFPDMHDVGDAAVRAGLRDPVLDVDRLSVSYEEPRQLLRDLTASGARNSLQQRTRAFVAPSRFREMLAGLESSRREGLLVFELELVYGHCWGPGQRAAPGEVRVDANRIGKRRT
ncbi:MAG: methyltransferase domain-containing protein [Woeseiaceae bacterium]